MVRAKVVDGTVLYQEAERTINALHVQRERDQRVIKALKEAGGMTLRWLELSAEYRGRPIKELRAALELAEKGEGDHR